MNNPFNAEDSITLFSDVDIFFKKTGEGKIIIN